MKKTLLLMLMTLPFISIKAQDVITLRDGSDIQAKIIEVNVSEIKYKRYSNPDGPIFTINKSDVIIVHYENGEKDVFSGTPQNNTHSSNTTETVVEGMKYNEYHNFYNTDNYCPQPTDPYSRGWAGIASAIIPGLGQGVAGEWGRGVLFFLGNLGINLLSYTQRSVDRYGYYTYTDLYWPIVIVGLAFDIWSICDAVHVAKVKNMYYQDIQNQRTVQLGYSISPFVTIIPEINRSNPFTGISLSLSF